MGTLDWDGLVVDHGEEVFIGSHGDDDAVECDAFELVAHHVEDLDFLVIGNSNPLVGTCYSRDVLPVLFPRLSIIKVPIFNSFQKLDSILGLIGIGKKLSVKVTKQYFLVDKQVLRRFILDLKVDKLVELCFVFEH